MTQYACVGRFAYAQTLHLGVERNEYRSIYRTRSRNVPFLLTFEKDEIPLPYFTVCK